ncbi:M20 family metallopeptidase [Anaeromicrobium sediminis]|uniref:Succinyl-diaminopimelate desuccinylase n=1 Tax=Anaeromicrobium sediminis TaxID=1478221 RepID=A0A267MHG9_9FIRM|nr:ArgE/DapE family deacylase [Anaeromicrobium sediminis]PAB59021.1 succinyl-diaminopimelate desuccinylase [Anaeromicrobium sediminis]
MKSLELLKELVKFQSLDRDSSKGVLDYCDTYLKRHGIQTEVLENNGYKMLVCEIGNGEKTIVLNGHLDIVSADKEDFEVYEKDGNLYGRGTADMKAGCASLMETIIRLRDKDLPCKVMLQLVTDEEIGGLNCSKYLVEKGYLGDFVICGEPTNLNIGLQAKGILQIDMDIHGKSAHGSRPWQGVNAITKTLEIYNNILDLPFSREKSELYDSPSINLSKLNGGEAYNKVPDLCSMSLDIRFLPEQKPEEILEQINSLIEGEATINLIGDPVKTKIDDDYVRKLKAVIKDTTEKEPQIFGQHGSADSRFFSKLNIPAIEFGPSGANWHGKNEYVNIESMKEYENILEKFIMNMK